MKNLTCILFMLFSIVTFSQEQKAIPKTKDIDKKVNISLDSLSKVYKKEVVSYFIIQRNDRKIFSISYYDKNKKLRSQVISNTPVE